MKKTYISPAQRWAIMEENYLQSMSKNETPAQQSLGMDSREMVDGDGGTSTPNIWNEW